MSEGEFEEQIHQEQETRRNDIEYTWQLRALRGVLLCVPIMLLVVSCSLFGVPGADNLL